MNTNEINITNAGSVYHLDLKLVFYIYYTVSETCPIKQ